MNKILRVFLVALLAIMVGNVSAEEVTMKYSGETTSTMTGGNDAATVGLDATEWSVVGAKGGASNFPSLNKAGDIRLYYNTAGSNTITVSSTNYVINTIAITFSDDAYSNVTVTVNGAAVSATDGKYAINSNSFVLGNGNTSNNQVRIKEVVINYSAGAQTTYTIEMKDDADNWTIEPAEAKAGTEVKATYKGKLKVKSVKAVEKVDGIDLSKVTANLELKDGDVVFGTLDGETQPYKISIADGATVTLNGATINGVNNGNNEWAGLTCADATIILADGSTNTVKGFYEEYPGIYVPEGKTLTIKGETNGTGKLTASSNGYGCGIGGGYFIASGNIVIEGGTVNATGGFKDAGIGGGNGGSCGTITINGGTVTATGGNYAAGIGSGKGTCGAISISGGTVTATGGNYAAGIGSGYDASCTSVEITTGVTSVTATKGSDATNSIEANTVTIGGTVTGNISKSPYTYNPNLQ